ncbi:hypothetical protein AVEN_64196-1 [Araneus ventricosus]|uniref:DUF4817 domain-containing protein n=1 Tax=Araneus ventricosus TaxID=182803 RepID=A0A4Y2HC64_ARAVE|nr:hypothetical protein AVEN_64196-1 [Araneus ventricosus]
MRFASQRAGNRVSLYFLSIFSVSALVFVSPDFLFDSTDLSLDYFYFHDIRISLNDISTLESSDEGRRNVSNSPYKLDEEIETNSYFDFESESDEVNLTSTGILNSSVSSVTPTSQEEFLSHKLRIWAVEHKVTLTSLNSLLNVLHGYHPELPLDATGSLRMVAMYSVRDYCDMYLMYDRCNGNALRTAREYARRYPSRRPPDINVIRRLDDTTDCEIREASCQQPIFTILEDHGAASR